MLAGQNNTTSLVIILRFRPSSRTFFIMNSLARLCHPHEQQVGILRHKRIHPVRSRMSSRYPATRLSVSLFPIDLGRTHKFSVDPFPGEPLLRVLTQCPVVELKPLIPDLGHFGERRFEIAEGFPP